RSPRASAVHPESAVDNQRLVVRFAEHHLLLAAAPRSHGSCLAGVARRRLIRAGRNRPPVADRAGPRRTRNSTRVATGGGVRAGDRGLVYPQRRRAAPRSATAGGAMNDPRRIARLAGALW